jgi:hypothetical protein
VLGNILFAMAWSFEFLIDLVFWTALFPGKGFDFDDPNFNKLMFVTQVLLHSFDYIVLWIDFIFNTLGCVKRNFIFIAAVAIIYLGVNCIVTLTWRPLYYGILEWNSWVTLITIIVCSILLLGHHLFVVKLYEKIKLKALGKDRSATEEQLLVEV